MYMKTTFSTPQTYQAPLVFIIPFDINGTPLCSSETVGETEDFEIFYVPID